jgi:hypothetical protein
MWCRAAAFFSSNIHGVHCAGLSDFSVCGAARRHFSLPIYTVFIVLAYQISQQVVPRGGIFLDKWRSSFAGNSEGNMNVPSACACLSHIQNVSTFATNILRQNLRTRRNPFIAPPSMYLIL